MKTFKGWIMLFVVGYAIGNKRSVSGAVEKVERGINSGVVTKPLDAVKGKVAGVVISNVGGDLRVI